MEPTRLVLFPSSRRRPTDMAEIKRVVSKVGSTVLVRLPSYGWGIITVRNEVAKVMFLHMSVILSTGGCLPQCMLGYHPPPPQKQAPLPQEQTSPRSRGADPPRRLLLWTVRILLVCILVDYHVPMDRTTWSSSIL